MRQRIVIHSGAYKTATSAVQTTLFANRDQLLSEQGLLVPETYSSRLAGVPDPNASSHNGLGHLVAASRSGADGAEERLRESLVTLAAEVRESGARSAVVSSEMLTGMPTREAAVIRDQLSDFDLRVVYSVRKVDDYLTSVALQRLKLEGDMHRHQPPYVTPFGGLLRWADVLGDDALTVLVYGFPSRSAAVVQTLEALGVDEAEKIVRDNPIHNPTLGGDGYVLRRLLNELTTCATERPLRRPLTEAIVARAYAFDASRANPKPLVAYSTEERLQMLEDTKEVHADIGARFLSPDASAAFLGVDDRDARIEDDVAPTWTVDEVAELADEIVGFLRDQPEVLAALGVDQAVQVEARRAARRAAQRESRLREELEAERLARSRAVAELAAERDAELSTASTLKTLARRCVRNTRKLATRIDRALRRRVTHLRRTISARLPSS